jgi:CheY-like chemotaxis protein
MASKILLVDDDREITRFLRATLEMVDRSFQFTETPSAEEAMLAVGRTAFDLIILDIVLPGMDGLEFARRILKQRPDSKIILLTGKPLPQIENEIRNLKIVAYFPKPVKPDDIITAASIALGIKPAAAKPAPSSASSKEVSQSHHSVSDRLSALRRDLGCLAVYLGDLDAHIVARAGDVSAFAVQELFSHVMVAFTASLKVCGFLGGFVPLNMHFFDGDDFDVYMINVGQSYSLIILFSGESGARAMGHVLRYGRQCADDLLNDLADTSLVAVAASAPAMVMPTLEKVPIVAGGETIEVELPVASSSPPPLYAPEPAEVLDIKSEELDAASKALSTNDLDSFWDEATTEGEGGSARANALSFEQATKLGLVPKENP